MNNYWETNYKAGQEGPTTFRYAIRPHGRFDAASAYRFGVERSQPLLAVPVDPGERQPTSLLHVEPEGVVVTALKPSDDGKGWVVRLFATSGRPETARIARGDGRPVQAFMSNLNEDKLERIEDTVTLPAYGIATLYLAGLE